MDGFVQGLQRHPSTGVTYGVRGAANLSDRVQGLYVFNGLSL